MKPAADNTKLMDRGSTMKIYDKLFISDLLYYSVVSKAVSVADWHCGKCRKNSPQQTAGGAVVMESVIGRAAIFMCK